MLRYREIELLEFPNAAMWKKDNVQLHTSRLFQVPLLSSLYLSLSPLLIFHIPHQPPRDPIPLPTPRILPTTSTVLLRLLFPGRLRFLLLRLLLLLRSSFLPPLFGVLVRFILKDASVAERRTSSLRMMPSSGQRTR